MRPRSLISAFQLFSLSAFLLLALLALGCTSPRPAEAGATRYEHVEYTEGGQPASRTTVEFLQNHNPETRSTLIIRPAGELEATHGTSWVQEIPKSFRHMETILIVSGVILLLIGAGFAYFRHWKLMSLAGLAGGALIALAATIEQYAWAYGLGLVAALAALGWYLWRRYLSTLSTTHTMTPGRPPAAPGPRAGQGRGAPSHGAGPLTT